MEDNLYCRYCGTELEDGIPVCPNCGRDNSVPMLGGRKRSSTARQTALPADEYSGPDDEEMRYEPELEERPVQRPVRDADISRARRPVTSAERAAQVRRPVDCTDRTGTERPSASPVLKEEKTERARFAPEPELPEETVPSSETGSEICDDLYYYDDLNRQPRAGRVDRRRRSPDPAEKNGKRLPRMPRTGAAARQRSADARGRRRERRGPAGKRMTGTRKRRAQGSCLFWPWQSYRSSCSAS